MIGDRVLLDTNVVIKFLAGKLPTEAQEIMRDREMHLSFISEIELRSFTGNDEAHDQKTIGFIPLCVLHGMSEVIKDEAVRLRKLHKLKTVDAIIAATAMIKRLPFVTGDKGLRRLAGELELIFVKYP